MNKIKQLYLITFELGIRYVLFRTYFEFKRKTGLLKLQFPLSYNIKSVVSLSKWNRMNVPFFFDSRDTLKFTTKPDSNLEKQYQKIRNGEVCFFHSEWKLLGLNYDWLTNPDSGYIYPLDHWSKIPSYNNEIGDIKYVWEKSRFCYLQDIIRYDYHFKKDSSLFVIDEILDWIEKNPLNLGPNYVCSQEISLRIINWTIALKFYSNSEQLSDSKFTKIIESIYGQAKHVEQNINFSRYLVRNNHAITECFLLYFVGQVYPFFKESEHWKEKGKLLLDKELLYQIYEDGSYIQHSHNYHRVMIQIATFYIQIANAAGDQINPNIKSRLDKTSTFLLNHRQQSGELPNYGANDGALFFKFSNTKYSNFSPQIAAFRSALGLAVNFEDIGEDIYWYGLEAVIDNIIFDPIYKAEKTGYYIVRKGDVTVYIRCGNHPHRPSQADNLHIDIWKAGENIIWDTGSYKYNTSKDEINYFWGTAGHNTLQLDDLNQMLKGERFLWHYWTSSDDKVTFINDESSIIFEGEISVYKYLSKKIRHSRRVILFEEKIEIIDTLKSKPENTEIYQNWHINPNNIDYINFETNGEIFTKSSEISRFFGIKSESILKKIKGPSETIRTTILFK